MSLDGHLISDHDDLKGDTAHSNNEIRENENQKAKLREKILVMS